MGAINVYIKPFKTDGTYADDYINVTPDVDRASLSSISSSVDNSDFDVGVFSYDSFSIRLNNQSGMYSEVDNIESIFRYRRSNSKVKITWLFGDYELICGIAVCGQAVLGPEETIFEGLLSDISSTQNIKDQKITFNILGKESVFATVEAPYASFAISDTVAETIFKALDQTEITTNLVLDIDNINPKLDFALDDVTDFENVTVKEVLDDLLAASNSILAIESDTIYVKSRDESATLMRTFYGQASIEGVEDIINLADVRNGVNRMFNYWTWKDTSAVSKDATSIATYGVRKKEISYGFATGLTEQQAILDELKVEFSTPRMELTMSTPMLLEVLQLKLLDKIALDYPTTSTPIGDNLIPIIGVVRVGEFMVPYSEYSLTLLPTDYFKIIEREINLIAETVTFKLRAV